MYYTVMGNTVKLTLLGAPPSLKNNQAMAVTQRGRRVFYTKANVKLWQKYALLQIKPRHCGHFVKTDKLAITCHVYYPNNRRDLDREAVWDILQKAGVIVNDRQFVEEHNYKHLDKANPRVEIEIQKAAL